MLLSAKGEEGNAGTHMPRVLFLVNPEYKGRILKLIAGKFSSSITYQIVSYAVGGRVRRNRLRSDDIHLWLFGDEALREAIMKFDPDVVLSDETLYGTHFEILSLLAGKRKPLIIHLRGDPWAEHRARFFTTEFPMGLLMIQGYAYSWASLLLASKVAAVCKWLEASVRHHIPGKRTELIPPPVDLDQYYPEEGLQFERPAVAIIQNHSAYPKVAGLIDFRRVVEKLPDIHFYVAEGEAAPQPFLPTVKEHYSGLDNVHFVGGIDGSAGVRKMLTACDCYVLATKLDCCPVTVLEASLMSRPVIASRVGGVPEIVVENETGWTISNDSVEAWVEKISLVLSDSKLCRRLGQNGKRFVSGHFGSDTIAAQMERFILTESSN
jgi:glycosyltransferase involved in cell wall biosynthesis